MNEIRKACANCRHLVLWHHRPARYTCKFDGASLANIEVYVCDRYTNDVHLSDRYNACSHIMAAEARKISDAAIEKSLGAYFVKIKEAASNGMYSVSLYPESEKEYEALANKLRLLGYQVNNLYKRGYNRQYICVFDVSWAIPQESEDNTFEK